MALAITDATFEEVEIRQTSYGGFWAAWCGPCRMVGPIIDELGTEYDGKVVVGKVDVDANQEFAAKYGEKYSNGIDFS
jgi:thioredoxin 1